MPGKNTYDETGNFGMGPDLMGPNNGKPSGGGGKDMGGTENMRANGEKCGPYNGKPSATNRDVKFAKVRTYKEDSV